MLKDRLELAMRGPPRITQVALARACKVSPAAVNEWIKGKTKKLEGANLIAAASFLRVSPEWLATGKEPKPGQVAEVRAPSQSARINPAILRDAYITLRNSLAMQGHVYDLAHDPELLCMVYDHLAGPEEASMSTLLDLGKRLSEARLAKSGAAIGQGDKTGRTDSGGV